MREVVSLLSAPALTVSAVVFVSGLMLSPSAWAQGASGIAGVVRDTSGGVLPGVTIEAASPALIEKVRTVVSDGDGRYSIVNIRPGTYVITFSLSGFSTFRREGIELPAGFTATVNADMQVGALEETITVTGATPLVDTSSVRQQRTVSNAVLESLPTGQASLLTLVNLTPGMTGNADVGGARGTFSGGGTGTSKFHGKHGVKTQYDGMRIQNFSTGQNTGYMFNVQAVQEMQMETGGLSAETSSTGMTMNLIPKEGGNIFTYSVSGLYMNEHLQGDNLTDDLRTRGLSTSPKQVNIWDIGATAGGPIRQDRLWFFGAWRNWGTRNRVGGLFWNATQGTMSYTPDPTRPAEPFDSNKSHAVRLTWQASQRNKVNTYIDIQKNDSMAGGSTTITNAAPEAVVGWHIWPTGLAQATWTMTKTNRLLFEAGAAAVIFHWPNFRQPGDIGSTDGSIVSRDAISILEQSTNLRYNAAAFAYGKPRDTDRYVQRFAVSYVTGSHAFKVGMTNEQGINNQESQGNGPNGVSYTFLNGTPVSLTQYALPYLERVRMKAEFGAYAQDQWAVKRLTINYGLRFDYVNMHSPEIHLPPGPFVPARDFAAVHKIPEWKDINPRVGASYDVFGNGRTALKASFGRYNDLTGSNFVRANNPLATSVNQVNRSWNDLNRNYLPDCDLTNFTLNGECGVISNVNFGKNNPAATVYADDVLHGYGVRGFLWDFSTEVQHQLGAGMSVSGGYYHNRSGNWRATDNLAVTPGDYSPYCITAPKDPRLPGGGGYQVCGLYDINQNKFGQSQNLTTQASHFTGENSDATCGSNTPEANTLCSRSDFFSINLDWRFGVGRLGAGIDTGRTVQDACFVIDSPQQLLNCRIITPFKAQTQVKLNGNLPLPADFAVSGTYQNLGGIPIEANYPATTAEIAPSLGRNLSGGTRTATVPLIAPQTMFEHRRTQIDLRLSKSFRLGTRARLQANVDVYNALNDNSVLTGTDTYGSSWQRPQVIMPARMMQISGKLDF